MYAHTVLRKSVHGREGNFPSYYLVGWSATYSYYISRIPPSAPKQKYSTIQVMSCQRVSAIVMIPSPSSSLSSMRLCSVMGGVLTESRMGNRQEVTGRCGQLSTSDLELLAQFANNSAVRLMEDRRVHHRPFHSA